jgi:hypothetical protein
MKQLNDLTKEQLARVIIIAAKLTADFDAEHRAEVENTGSIADGDYALDSTGTVHAVLSLDYEYIAGAWPEQLEPLTEYADYQAELLAMLE